MTTQIAAPVGRGATPVATRPAPRRPEPNRVLGSGWEFNRDPIRFMERLAREHPDIVRVRFGPVTVHLVGSPDIARHVLHQTHANYVGHPIVTHTLSSLGGENLFTASGERWREQRTMLQPSFHKKVVSGFGDIMVDEARRATADWGDRPGPVPMARTIQDATFNIFARSLFSIDLAGSDQLRAINPRGTDWVTRRFRNPALPPLLVPTPDNLRVRSANRQSIQHLQRVIDDRRVMDDPPHDFLQMLLDATYEDGTPLEDEMVINQARMFFVGGNGPPAKIVTWGLYHLARDAAAQERLHEELDRELGDRPPTLADLPRLRYLDMIVDELLRLYPTAFALPRKCVNGDELGGYHVPPGAGVVPLLYTMHRHRDHWDDPDRFDPERFSPERTGGRPPAAYLPWGAGPRLCIAKQISLLQMKIVLATVAQRYRMTCEPGYTVRPVIGFPLGPEGPVMLTPERR
jgi:cytochrome P450